MISKNTLRKLILDCRRLLAEGEFKKRNADLCDQVLSLIREKDYQSIHFFLPIERNREVDFTALFPVLWAEGRKIMLSKTDFTTKQMSHFWFDPKTKLVKNKFDIPEPADGLEAPLDQADLMLVPLLIADHSGNRLGYGGGFYDRLLANFGGHSVGVCLSPLVDKLGTEPWDIPVKQLLFFQPTANLK